MKPVHRRCGMNASTNRKWKKHHTLKRRWYLERKFDTFLQLMEDATKAMFGWQHEVLKFADMRAAANMSRSATWPRRRTRATFRGSLVEHVSNLYEHISHTAAGYSQRVQHILRGGSSYNLKSAPSHLVHVDAKQGTGSKCEITSTRKGRGKPLYLIEQPDVWTFRSGAGQAIRSRRVDVDVV